MTTINLSGNVTKANGEVLLIIIYDSDNEAVWKSTPTTSFFENIDLDPGNYSIDLMGATLGIFTFEVTGCTTITPLTPKNYNKKISDSYDITI